MADAEGTDLQRIMQVYQSRMAQVALAGDQTYAPPGEKDFVAEDGEPRDYLVAPDLQSIAATLIDECDEFAHLRRLSVVLLWKREGGQKGGHSVLGKCVKPSGLVEHFANADWIVWAAADHAWDLGLTRQQIEALCYHELAHAGEVENSKGETKPKLVQHDWEGFSNEVKRYGAWDDRLTQCKEIWRQGEMFGE